MLNMLKYVKCSRSGYFLKMPRQNIELLHWFNLFAERGIFAHKRRKNKLLCKLLTMTTRVTISSCFGHQRLFLNGFFKMACTAMLLLSERNYRKDIVDIGRLMLLMQPKNYLEMTQTWIIWRQFLTD